MKILALDPGNLCGWCHSAGAHGVWSLTCTGSEHHGNRYLRLINNLRMIHDHYGVEQLWIENASQGSPHISVQVSHNKMLGVVEMFSAEVRASIHVISPPTIKKFAGHGQYSKEQMIRAAEMILGIKVTDDNEADAVWLCELAKHTANDRLAKVAAKMKAGPRGPVKKDPLLF